MASVLILGAGGRENALAWKISQSPQVGQVYVYPGNAGTDLEGGIIKRADITNKNHKDIIDWCKSKDIKLVVIGPEDFLADGFSDAFSSSGIPCFGPSAEAAQIESSKAFSKALMTKYDIPTAAWSSFTDAKGACDFINNAKFPALVVKASGLAAGKGVVVAKSKEEACSAVREMLEDKVFGEAGNVVVVEELLEGEEVSCMAFCDGKNLVCMPPSQDHKRLLAGDEGPNTGGMGAYCPVPKVTMTLMKEIEEKVLKKTMKVMEEEGYPFVGVLYAGMMLTASGPKVLEFNCRFGDPETQALMVLLKSDLYEVMQQCVRGKLNPSSVEFENDKFALGIVLASEGYPGSIKKNIPISNIEVVRAEKNINIFHSGTAFNEDKQLVTSGGRVMTIVATSDSLESALSDAKKGAETIHFEGKQFRDDIGWRSLTQKVSLTYKESGVDIAEGDLFVTKLKPLASSTSRSGVMGCVGSFGAMFDLARTGYKDPLLVSGTDGVGTKLKIAQMMGKHDTIGIDLVAMCVNDVLCHGAEPLFFLDYFSCGKLKSDMAIPIIEGISKGCKMAGCALVGGETAEMPGMYNKDEYDLAGFAVGAVERSCLLPSAEHKLVEGDVAIAIPSSGFHSNGFSLVRKVLEFNGISMDEKCPFDDTMTVGGCMLSPTTIYVKSLLPLMKKGNIIKAAAHITGGGLPGNVERVIPQELAVHLDALNWNIPPVFSWIQALGNISEEEMLKTFNCGIGMVIFVDPTNKDLTLGELKSSGFESSCVGHVCHKEANQQTVVIENFRKSLKKSLNFEIKSKHKQKKVAVLISGSGTNLQSLIDSSRKADSPYYIGLVISNVGSAYGLERAKLAGIPTMVVSHKDFKNRALFDAGVHKHLLEHNIELVCLAGFMRILSDEFVANWHGKMLNIHPSLLPSFKGLHVHKSVLEAGCLISGCTVHFVSNELDGGAIVAQESVPVLPGDTEDDLCERVKTVEHKAYPRALRLLASEKIAQMMGKQDTIGIDLVAMCVNDVLCHGAEPLFFLDYFSCGKLKSDMAIPIIEGISKGCKMAGCALVGGETAEMPGMYNKDEYDLAGFAVGAVERSCLLPSAEHKLVEGDVAIAIPSSGFHSNGFSLVRKVLEFNGISMDEKCPFDDTMTVGGCMLSPTTIYVKSLLPLMKKGNIIKAAAHITGGGLPGNVERVIPQELAVHLDALNWNIPPVFSWIQALGNISEEEMLKTFNCGIGMVIFVDPTNKDLTLGELKSSGFESSCVGHVCHKEANQQTVVIENFRKSLKKSLNFEIKSKHKQKKVAVLISGSGTNLQSLIDSSRKADSPYYIGLVISNVGSAYGLERAKLAGIPTMVVSHKDFKNRALFDAGVHKHLLEHNIELVCLAGFMRILSDEFVANWHGKMLNIHPSLLPSFKGLHVHKSVLEAGCLISGCTVHFVSNELDGGAIVAQESVPVLPGDTEDDLCERVKTVEHKAYPRALRLLASEKVYLNENGKVTWA